MSEVIPKQAIQSELNKKSLAVQDLVSKVDISITERVSAEGSVISAKIGTEKDGFTSLTAATTKGSASEGPTAALLGENIKKGSVVSAVSSSAKLTSVTGGSKRQTAVLNETVVQGSIKGMRQGLKSIGVSNADVEKALKDASPIPSKAGAAIRTENKGGVAKQAAFNVSKASGNIINELQKPFGSNNPFGAVGSSFGNIFAQVVSLAVNGPQYQTPTLPTKLSSAATVINRQNSIITTPNIVNSNGTTNIKGISHKSKLQASDTEYKEDIAQFKIKAVQPGRSTDGYNGALTRLRGDIPLQLNLEIHNDGGQYQFSAYNSKEAINADLRSIEREITSLVIGHWSHDLFDGVRPMLEELHINRRINVLRDDGDAAVNAEPLNFGIPCHFFQNFFGCIQTVHPLNLPVPRDKGRKPARKGQLYFFMEGSADTGNKITPNQMKFLGQFIDEFLDVFPGAEILGINEISEDEAFSRVPFFNVRDLVNSRNRKPSVLPDTPGDIVEVPPASELADRKPQNIVIPKKNPNVRPSVSRVADIQNKTANAVTEKNYSVSQADALKNLKRKKDNIIDADKLTGDGLGGSLVGKITSLDTNATSLLKDAQSLKLDNLKNNKVFDTIKGVFKNG